MGWGDNGVTNKRFLIDQSANVTWGNTALRVPTRAFNQVGYLRRLVVKVPPAAGALTITTANVVAANALLQNPGWAAIGSIDITAQGIAPLYQLGKGGKDLSFLSYIRNGRQNPMVDPLGLVANTGYANTTSLGRQTALNQYVYFDVEAAAASGTVQNVRYGGTFDLPLTEWVKFPATTMQGPNGPVQVAAQDVEVGLVTLQNTQQNVVPHVTLNPLWSPGLTGTAGYTDTPFLSTTTIPSAGSLAAEVDFWTEFYDVPANPQDQPPPYSQMFIISRTSADDPVTGGSVTHTFQPAGLLMRAIHCFYDVNGAIVDISPTLPTIPANGGAIVAGAAEPNITFKWGATVLKSQERLSTNLYRAAATYGDNPPAGAMYLDFFNNREITDLINTATLTSVQSQITNLPAAVVSCHTIEERMIPVRLG